MQPGIRRGDLPARDAGDGALGSAAVRGGRAGAHGRLRHRGHDRHAVSHEGLLEDQGQDPARVLRRRGRAAASWCSTTRCASPRSARGTRPTARTSSPGRSPCTAREPGDLLRIDRARARAARAVRRDLEPARPRRAAGGVPAGAGHRERLRRGRGARTAAWSACCRRRADGERVARFPLAPFLGIMGVAVAGRRAPALGAARRARRQHRHQPARRGHARSTCRCRCAGALAYVGDPHFAQGDGEVALTAHGGLAAGDAALRRGPAGRGARRVRRRDRPARRDARVPRADRAGRGPRRGRAALRARGASRCCRPGSAWTARTPTRTSRRDRLRHLAGGRPREGRARAHPDRGLR